MRAKREGLDGAMKAFMRDHELRPRLRALESIIIPDEGFGQVIVLRDFEGIASAPALIPPPLLPVLRRFTGELTIEQITREASREAGHAIPVEVVRKLALTLDRGLFLDSPRFRAERDRIKREFVDSPVRPAAHAGGAYYGEASKLRRYLDDACLAQGKAPANRSRIRALIAPHIDPWRGAVGYGNAYSTLARYLPPEADTFVILGTSHALMNEPFALCRKAFETPLGTLAPDEAAIDALESLAEFNPYADLFNHKREHSIELQTIFVRHLVGERPVTIVPILCGLGESQRTGADPANDRRTEGFIEGLRRLIDERDDRVVVIAGADLAHVGPRFGDAEAYDVEARERLRQRDEASMRLAIEGDARGFFAHVFDDLDSRRVCGLGPIYTLLRLVPSGLSGELLHYEQTIDPEEGSIVSHAAAAFFA